MSKRSRASQDEPAEPPAKRVCTAERELPLGLLDILTTSGIGDAFYASFDALTQRALCCACTEYRAALKDRRAALLWHMPLHPQIVDDGFLLAHCSWPITQGYWRSQLALVLRCDHAGRLQSLLRHLNTPFYISPYPSYSDIFYWACKRNAISCIRALRTWVSEIDSVCMGVSEEAILTILDMQFTGGYKAVARNILVNQRWALLIRIILARPRYRRDLLIRFRKCVSSHCPNQAWKRPLMLALRPYGKKVPVDSPDALRKWLTAQIEQAQRSLNV